MKQFKISHIVAITALMLGLSGCASLESASYNSDGSLQRISFSDDRPEPPLIKEPPPAEPTKNFLQSYPRLSIFLIAILGSAVNSASETIAYQTYFPTLAADKNTPNIVHSANELSGVADERRSMMVDFIIESLTQLKRQDKEQNPP